MSDASLVAIRTGAGAAGTGVSGSVCPRGSADLIRTRPALTRLFLGLSLAAVLGLAAAAPARALSPEELERRVQAITDDLRCPTCQAISVKDSEAAFSVEIRDKVQRMVEEGQSDEDIKAYFVSRYGEWILRSPKKAGFGLLVWILPIAAIFAGGALLVVSVMRRSRAKGVSAPPAPSLSAEQRERVRADLKRFEEDE